MRWLLLLMVGCGGTANEYDQIYPCPDACVGAASVTEVRETNYDTHGQPWTATYLMCKCVGSGQTLKFIRPYNQVACTTIKAVWDGFCG